MPTKFDVDPYALAEEVSALLEKEREKPEAIRMSFKQLTAYVYRGHNIRGECWHDYNRAIGSILGSRPKKSTPKETVAVREPSSLKKHEVLSRGTKYTVRSVFDPGDALHVLVTPPDSDLLFMKVNGKVKCYMSGKVEKHLRTIGMQVAKARFAEKDGRQGELNF